MRRSTSCALTCLTAVALCVFLPGCRNQATRGRQPTVDPTTQKRVMPSLVPPVARNNPDADVQGGAQFQRVNSLIGQWDLAKSEGMAVEADRIAQRIRQEVDQAFPAFSAAAEGQRGVATQYLATSALGFSSYPGATQVIVKRLYDKDERLVSNALVALNERKDPSTPLDPVLRYIDPRAPLLPKRYAPLVLASVHDARLRAGNPIPMQIEQTALPRLLAISNDTDGYTRLHVTKALGRLGGSSESAIDALILRMGDDEMRIRWAAAAALERTGSPRGYPEVVRLLHEVSPTSKHIIRDLLISYAGRLQGRPLTDRQIQDLGSSAAQWTRWYSSWRASKGLGPTDTRAPRG